MENLTMALTDAIKDVMKETDKRFADQQNTQETQAKQVEELQKQAIILENKCKELSEENVKLKAELQSTKSELDAEHNKKNTALQNELKSLQDQFKDFSKHIKYDDIDQCIKLTKGVAEEVLSLIEAKVNTEKRMEELHSTQNELTKKIKRLQLNPVAQTTPFSYRANLLKSPSASSYLNSNSNPKSLLPRPKFIEHQIYSNNYNNRSPHFESLDPSDDISELSDKAENLMKGIEAIHDLQRDYEKSSSFYSND